MASTPPPSAAVSPSLSLTLTPSSSHNTHIAPTLDPVYIAAEAAAAVLASDSLVQAHSLSVLPPTPAALATLNGFLDHLVLILLFRARSSLIDPLRNAVKQVFKNQLAHDAIAEGEAELRAYIRTPEEEYALLGTPAPVSSDSSFDAELAWRMARVRCMVYSSLGNVDESDVLKYTPEQRSLFSTADSLDLPDLISPIATIFLTAILEFVAEHVLLVAGRAVLSRYLVASTSRPHLATGVLLLEEVDVDKLALDPQVGKVWRHWKKRSRELPLNTSIQYPSTSPTLVQSLEQVEVIPAQPDQEEVLGRSTDIFDEAIMALNGKYKKVRPISVDNGVLSLDADDSQSQEEEYDELTRQLGERSIPVTPAIIQERRKSRPWSFHGQRFSLYESFATLTGTPFASPMRIGSETAKENVQVPSTNQNMESTVEEGIDEEDPAQVLDQMIADVASQPSSGTTPGTPVSNLTRQLLPEAFDTASREEQQLETERHRTIDFDVSDDPSNTISDHHPTSPASYYFSASQFDNAVYQEEEHVGAIPSSNYDVDGDSFDGTIDDDDDRNRSRRRPSSIISEGKSHDGDNDAPVILLASAPPSGYSRSYSIEERPDAATSTSSKRLSTSGISTKMKGKSGTPIAETTIPGFGTTVPTEKVRKYIWISNQKFDDGSGSSGSNTSLKGDSPELEHVSFERLLKSDITYKLNLTPDKLREAKPFYGTNHTRASLVSERSISARLPELRSGSASSINPTSQSKSEPPTRRSSSSGSISTVSASQQLVSGSSATRSSSSTLRRLQPMSSTVSPASQSSPEDRQPANGAKSLPASATAALPPLKHVRNESVKAAAGATHELMNLLRLSSSREDLKDDDEGSPKSRPPPGKSLEYVRTPSKEIVDEYHHSPVRQKGDVTNTDVHEIPERYKQSQWPQQAPREVKRSPSIMNRLGFSGVIGAVAKSENTPLSSTSSTGAHPVYRKNGEIRRHGTSNSSRSSSSSLAGGVSGIGIPKPASNKIYKTMPRDKSRGERDSATADLAHFLRTTGPDESPYQASCESLSSPGGLKPEKNRRSSFTNKTGLKGSSNDLPKRDRKKGVRFLGFLKGEKHVAV
ncbi:hypothetical protein V1523DRAFT_407441 [Lipomyces doorenjongii]